MGMTEASGCARCKLKKAKVAWVKVTSSWAFEGKSELRGSPVSQSSQPIKSSRNSKGQSVSPFQSADQVHTSQKPKANQPRNQNSLGFSRQTTTKKMVRKKQKQKQEEAMVNSCAGFETGQKRHVPKAHLGKSPQNGPNFCQSSNICSKGLKSHCWLKTANPCKYIQGKRLESTGNVDVCLCGVCCMRGNLVEPGFAQLTLLSVMCQYRLTQA